MKPEVRIGTSGWSYPGWRGTIYPKGLPASRELAHASGLFDSLEINRSFYSLLTPASCAAWYDATPKDFLFALKGSRYITHLKKLRGVTTALANFFASGPLLLGEKLGPVVWQLPASQRFDAAALEGFFAELPRTSQAASRLAAQHDDKPRHGTHTSPRVKSRIRHALEARHESFFTPEALALLRQHEVALVVSDSPLWQQVEHRTADFMYVRLHGSAELYASSYEASELSAWAKRVRRWRGDGQDVYFYFDNDLAGHAVRNAQALQQELAIVLPKRTVSVPDSPPRGRVRRASSAARRSPGSGRAAPG